MKPELLRRFSASRLRALIRLKLVDEEICQIVVVLVDCSQHCGMNQRQKLSSHNFEHPQALSMEGSRPLDRPLLVHEVHQAPGNESVVSPHTSCVDVHIVDGLHVEEYRALFSPNGLKVVLGGGVVVVIDEVGVGSKKSVDQVGIFCRHSLCGHSSEHGGERNLRVQRRLLLGEPGKRQQLEIQMRCMNIILSGGLVVTCTSTGRVRITDKIQQIGSGRNVDVSLHPFAHLQISNSIPI